MVGVDRGLTRIERTHFTVGSKSIWYIGFSCISQKKYQANFNKIHIPSLNRHYLSKNKRKMQKYFVDKYLLTKKSN